MLTYTTAYLMFGTFSALSRFANEQQWMLLGVVFFNTFLVPAGVTWLTQGNMQLERQSDRSYPILFGALLHGITWYFVYQYNLPAFYSGFFLAVTLSLVLGVAVNLAYRISFHTIGAGLLAGLFVGLQAGDPIDYRPEMMVAFLLAGMVASARWALGAHKPGQLLTGFVLGAGLAIALVMTGGLDGIVNVILP